MEKIEDMDLGDRMKAYEGQATMTLDKKLPAIIRIDGRAFHSYTRGFERPFDKHILEAMMYTTTKLCEEVQNAKIGYAQSDEISILMTVDSEMAQPWFDGKTPKILSVSASIATSYFNEYMDKIYWQPQRFRNKMAGEESRDKMANFDSRVFNLPVEEVNNYFWWREQDAIRNSIQSVSHTHYSQKQLHKKNTAMMLEMLREEKKVDWGKDIPIHLQRGYCAVKEHFEKDGGIRSKWSIDYNIPLFKDDRNYVGKFLEPAVI
jgi:tRNA(His) guanylyltransferase